jgi:hypothetical protein
MLSAEPQSPEACVQIPAAVIAIRRICNPLRAAESRTDAEQRPHAPGVARHILDELGDLASRECDAPGQRGDDRRDDKSDREPTRHTPVGQSTQQRREDEAQYAGERQRDQEIASHIERRQLLANPQAT